MKTVKKPEKSRSDVHAEFMAKFSPELVAKVSRIVNQRRAMHGAMQRASEEYLDAHREVKRLEGERNRIPNSGATDGRSDWIILGRLVDSAKLRMKRAEEEKARIDEPYRIATVTAENVLKALTDEMGGGMYQADLFETMGWR